MTHSPGSTTPRHNERGEALTAALVVLCIFVALVLLIAVISRQQQQAAEDEQGTHSESGDYAAEDNAETGPLVVAHGCIIFARHPRVTPSFINKVVQISGPLRTDPNFLMATFKIESDFNHTIRNTGGGSATGLNQIIDSSARAIGLPNAASLASMSAVQQLEYVRRYYVMAGGVGRMNTPEDCYLVTFYPKAVGKPENFVIARKSKECDSWAVAHDAYCGNRAYDFNRDGILTKSEAARKIRVTYDKEIRKCASGGGTT